MKTAIIILAISTVFLGACDKVTKPVEKSQVAVSKRTVLLEDYTGHQCGNCPAAAQVAEKLAEQYGEKLIVVSVHAGFFSRVNSKFPTSYTTTASVEWDKYFIGNAGNPNGMVNRKNYADNGVIHTQGKWSSVVALAMQDIHYLDLSLTPGYNPATRKLTPTVKAKFARSYGANTGISVVLVEDSVVGPQLDYNDPSGDDYVPQYVFRYMLRDDINGVWGSTLRNAPIANKDSVSITYPAFTVKSNYNDNQLYLVAFVFDEASKEVLQAARIKLR